jgi:hypothetical protein
MSMIRLRRWSAPSGFIFLTAIALCCWHNPKLAAQNAGDKSDKDKWLVDRALTLTPRSVPVPALAYRLLPLASELKEGNAVPIYLRLAHEQNDENQRLRREKPAEWNQLPLDQLPVQEVRNFLKSGREKGGVRGPVTEYVMKQLDLGARRKNADWNYTLDAGDPIAILLPDAQMMRIYGGLLVLKARMQIAEGDYAAAAYTLQTGFAFSRHIVEGPFLVNGLVGMAIAGLLEEVLFDWVSRPEAPNLYWSLTALPRPLINLRHEFEIEYRMMEMQFPDMADLKRERAPAEWDAALKRVRTEFDRIWGNDRESDRRPRVPMTVPTDPAAQSPELPAAKKYLVEQMRLPADKVDAMPPSQVLLLCIEGINNDLRDDLFKAAYLPTPQAIPVVEAAQKRLLSTPNTETTRLSLLLLPAIPKVIVAATRTDRKIAALRAIEALRIYAANHQGQLPDKLADITDVPVPNDPSTGKPFEYERDKNTATLIAPPFYPPIPKLGLRYRLTIKGKE